MAQQVLHLIGRQRLVDGHGNQSGRLADQTATRSCGCRPSATSALPSRLTARAYSLQLIGTQPVPALKKSAGASGRCAAVRWKSAGTVSGKPVGSATGSGARIAVLMPPL